MNAIRTARRLFMAATALLIVAGETAATTCAAGNPNTTSLVETTPAAAFVVNGNGTATHNLTGLMWKQCPEGLSGSACGTGTAVLLTWQDALAASGSDSTGGFIDWRLPNVKELESIIELCGSSPAINTTVFPATPFAPTNAFWSSTTYNNSFPAAFAIHFQRGEMQNLGKVGPMHVRLVRGGRAANTFDARSVLACTVDIDGDGTFDALTDGLLLIRALFGLTGTAVTAGALSANAKRTTWPSIRDFINANCGTMLGP